MAIKADVGVDHRGAGAAGNALGRVLIGAIEVEVPHKSVPVVRRPV
jgi:hypothetical protein